MTLNIFDAYGHIRNLDDETDAIAALPDDQRAKMFACIKAVTDRDEGEARVVASRKRVRTAEAAYNEAVMALDQVTPVRDTVTGFEDHSPRAGANINPAIKNAQRVAAARAVSAAQHPGYVTAKPVKNKLKSAAEQADAELIEARAELQRATTEQRPLDTAAGETANAWRSCINIYSYDPSLPEHIARSNARTALVKDQIARGNADRLARCLRGESPEPPKPVPNYQSELDRVRGAEKRKVRPLISRPAGR
jgi:hypothetical protein